MATEGQSQRTESEGVKGSLEKIVIPKPKMEG